MMKKLILVIAIACMLVGCSFSYNNSTMTSTSTTGTSNTNDFSYSLKAVEKNGEIEIIASLTYTGNEENIDITHAASPFYFYITEKTRNYEIDYPMNIPLITTTLYKEKALEAIYHPSGSYSEKDDAKFVSFMKEFLSGEFPPGDYEVRGVASFTANEEDHNIESTLTFHID